MLKSVPLIIIEKVNVKASGEQFNCPLVMATRQNKCTSMARSLFLQGVIEVRSAQRHLLGHLTWKVLLHETQDETSADYLFLGSEQGCIINAGSKHNTNDIWNYWGVNINILLRHHYQTINFLLTDSENWHNLQKFTTPM